MIAGHLLGDAPKESMRSDHSHLTRKATGIGILIDGMQELCLLLCYFVFVQICSGFCVSIVPVFIILTYLLLS